ncbi:MAG: aldo/keto reductase, partial [Crocinitomicaceae bacterium]
IDTAEMYAVPGREETQGLTEKYIGTWLKDRKDRDQLVIATKVTGPSAMTWIRDGKGYNKDVFTTTIDNSLKRLQTDYVDLYQLHWPMRKMNMFSVRGVTDIDHQWEDNFQEILEGLDTLIKAGKVRNIGISNENPWGMSRYLHLSEMHDLPRMVSIQNPYNLLNRTFEVGLSEMAIREKCGLLAYSPMGFGLLSGKFHKKKDTPNDRLNQFKQMARYSSENSWKATEAYMKIAEASGMSLAEMSLAWVSSRPFVTSNIIGATNMDQLKENIGSIQIELEDSIIEAIEEVHKVIPNPAP